MSTHVCTRTPLQCPVVRKLALARRHPTTRASVATHATAELSPARCRQLMVEENFAYLDVRSTQEFEPSHAEGAINVPLMHQGPNGLTPNDKFLEEVQQEFPDSDIALVVGCKSGRRSAAAIAALAAEGYTTLVNVAGGWDAWKSEA